MTDLSLALLILRLVVGLTFAAHGAQKLWGWWGGPGMANWRGAMQAMGFRPAPLFAAVSALTELAGGLLLALGLVTPVVAALLVAQSLVIIGQVHWAKGFFNTGGGYEFPLVLAAGVVATGLVGAGDVSVDASLGLAIDPTARLVLLLAGGVAGLVTLALPRLTASAARTDRAQHA